MLAACSSGGPIPTPTAAAGATGKMTIGISFDQPGIGLKSGTTYSGFDVETAKYVAAALQASPENITWKEANPSQRENLLVDKEVDMVFSSYSITDARKQKVDFAGPYFVAHQDLLIRRNDEGLTGPRAWTARTSAPSRARRPPPTSRSTTSEDPAPGVPDLLGCVDASPRVRSTR
jgi:glutamate transport system substrate-binding protein